MIKAAGTGEDGRPVLILGLSRANCSRMLGGMPIQFDAKPYGFDGHILICAGANEQQIAEAILGDANDPRIKVDPDPNAA